MRTSSRLSGRFFTKASRDSSRQDAGVHRIEHLIKHQQIQAGRGRFAGAQERRVEIPGFLPLLRRHGEGERDMRQGIENRDARQDFQRRAFAGGSILEKLGEADTKAVAAARRQRPAAAVVFPLPPP